MNLCKNVSVIEMYLVILLVGICEFAYVYIVALDAHSCWRDCFLLLFLFFFFSKNIAKGL